MERIGLVGILLTILSAIGCAGPGGTEGDGADDSFGGSFAKADGFYSECELREVLVFVNASTTDEEALKDVLSAISTGRRVAGNIIEHRNGPDGDYGTADDARFQNLGELDDVPYVGPVTLDLLAAHVAPECDIDLSTRPFINAETFAGTTGGGWTRDNEELEATYAVRGVRGSELRAALLDEDSRGRTTFRRMRGDSTLEAFTYGFGIDEMPWDRDAHDAREDMPYVMLTIEGDRFVPDEETGTRELSLGTDINDDTYFDNQDFALLHHELVLRGRIRWDDATTVRRLLIQSKEGSSVDDEGIKSAAKIDIRRDSPSAEQIASLDDDVMRGMVSWQGSDTPVEPIRFVYEQLSMAGVLPNIDGREDVLLLDPMAHVRSTRSRFHYNEVSETSLRNIQAEAASRVDMWVARGEEALASGGLSADDANTVQLMVDAGNAILDRTAVATRANDAIAAAGLTASYDETTVPTPDTFRNATTEDVEVYRLVAEAYSELHHELSELLDDCDRILTGSTDRDWDDYAEYYVAWARSEDQVLGRNTVMEPYFDRFNAQSADVATHSAAFNAWVGAQRDDGDDDFEDFEEIDADGWEAMGRAIELELNKIHQRQIDMAGTLARALWFDAARELYVPASSRRTGNFIINTFDMADMIAHDEWIGMSDAERAIDQVIPAERVFHTTLVNEVQIELGSEEAYLDRIAELQALVDGGMATPEDEANLRGARFVFNQYRSALVEIAELREDRIQRFLERQDIDDAEWAPATESKGQAALRILADEGTDPQPRNLWGGLDGSGTLASGEESRFASPTLMPGNYRFEIQGSGDADLYVRVGAAPTTSDYDCRPYGSDSDEVCDIELTDDAVVHVMVRGYRDSEFTLLGGLL